jgi:hypothetical protein
LCWATIGPRLKAEQVLKIYKKAERVRAAKPGPLLRNALQGSNHRRLAIEKPVSA